MSLNSKLSVVSALHGKAVFITGVTGFLGKSIVEKILRETPNVAQIYLLVRGSQRQSAQQRSDEKIFASNLFDSLREQLADGFDSFITDKVTVVDGELTAYQFGLSDDAFSELANQLDLIINSAASVNFREAIDQALEINTLCLNNIVALSNANDREVTPVLQVSTCYVNGFNEGLMTENVASSKSGQIQQLAEGIYDTQSVIDGIQFKITQIKNQKLSPQKYEQKMIQLGIEQSRYYGWNDTYKFTKWLGEQLLIQQMNQQDLTILRPSIIESAYQAPAPGWVEGVKVADALIYAYAKGRVSIFPGDDEGVLDVIPVDIVANAALLSAAQLLQAPSTYRIYQCCSGSTNPILLKQFVDYVQQASLEQYAQLPKLFAGKPQDRFKTISPKRFGLYMLVLTIFTWFRTSIGRAFGSNKASALLAKTKTTASLAMIFGFYTAPKYRFDNSQLIALHDAFSEEEQARFNAKADQFDWKHYLQDIHLPGLHQYALAGKPSLVKADTPVAKKAA